MHLAFDIFQGIGIASAVGIRPFLPALAAGALAAGDVEISFKGTDYSFLQSAPFLVAVGVAAVVLLMLERARGSERSHGRETVAVLVAVGLVLAALLFAASLARGHYPAWPGYIGGAACAALAAWATRPLLMRAGRRLERDAAALVPLYAEGSALLLAVLSIVAPPVGVLGLLATMWLLLAGRKREGQKYAGLRILR